MVQINASSIYIIGGYQNNSISNKTWIIDSSNEFQIREGPILSQARWDHSCGQFNINDTAFIAVAGGVGAWQSLELLDLTEFGNEWMTGRVEFLHKKQTYIGLVYNYLRY